MCKGYFISGNDTNVGKTIVSAILVKKLNANYYKPIQCGKNEFFLNFHAYLFDLS